MRDSQARQRIDGLALLGGGVALLGLGLFLVTVWRIWVEVPLPPAVADPWDHWVVTTYPNRGCTALAMTGAVVAVAVMFTVWRVRRGRTRYPWTTKIIVLVVTLFAGNVFFLPDIGTNGGYNQSFASIPLPAETVTFTPSGNMLLKVQWLVPDHHPIEAGVVDESGPGNVATVVRTGFSTLGRGFLASFADGTWHDHAIPQTVQSNSTTRPPNLWCWSMTTCAVMKAGSLTHGTFFGGIAAQTVNGGASWRTVFPGFDFLDVTVNEPMSCGPPGWCVLLSNGSLGTTATLLTTTDEGATWEMKPFTLGSDVGAPVAISCDTPTVCTVVLAASNGILPASGQAIHPDLIANTTDGGVTWSRHDLPNALNIDTATAIACPTPGWCAVIDQPQGRARSVFSSTDDAGATWASTPLPKELMTTAGWFPDFNLVCTAPTDCLLAGDRATDAPNRNNGGLVGSGPQAPWFERTDDGGRTWTSVRVPAQIARIDALSCDGAHCAASVAADRPAATVPADLSRLPRVTVGTIMTSQNGGVSWKLIPPPTLRNSSEFTRLHLG